ncbi:MAG TPA: potassium-transporting ATPase subunit KdpA [Anaerolineales bacterium]
MTDTNSQRAGIELPRSAIDNLRAGLRGSLLLPGEPGYDDARSIWNAMIDRRPALIVRCLGAADVITGVNFARERGLPLSIKGGGHNISGLAVCDGGLMLAAMTVLFVAFLALGLWAERQPNPRLAALGVEQTTSRGLMEGKEVRFGVASSVLWSVATTAASNGSVNAMHDSFTPMGGMVPLWMIELGEVVYGGVGSGLYGMLIYAIIAATKTNACG